MGTVEPSCEGTKMLMMLFGMIAFVRPACTSHQHHRDWALLPAELPVCCSSLAVTILGSAVPLDLYSCPSCPITELAQCCDQAS